MSGVLMIWNMSPRATGNPMGGQKPVRRLTLACLILGAVSGCATYTKCGFHGCAGDAQITSDVRTLFNQHPALEPPNLIDVQTLDRVVYLYGLVDTDLERQLAESVARTAPGVVRVVDSIGLNNVSG